MPVRCRQSNVRTQRACMSDDFSTGRRRFVQALTAAPLGATAAPSEARSAAQPSAEKVLRYAFEVSETGFDPAHINDLYSRIVIGHVYYGLYDYDYLARPYRIIPNAAEAMPEVSDNYRVWTVRLKRGIVFQDDPVFKGRPRELVAEDYVYSLKRFFDPRWKAPTYATLAELKMIGMAALREQALKNKRPFDYDTPVEGLRTLDRYTIQFRVERPLPRLIQTLASGDLYGAVCREVVEAYGDDIAAHPIGTGPFRLADWRRSSKIFLVRNPTYRRVVYEAEPAADDPEGQALLARFKGRTLPMIDRVEISIIEETQPRWLSFLNKQQDRLERLPGDFINIAAPNGVLAPHLARQNVQLWRTLNADVTYTYFNMQDPVVGGQH